MNLNKFLIQLSHHSAYDIQMIQINILENFEEAKRTIPSRLVQYKYYPSTYE